MIDGFPPGAWIRQSKDRRFHETAVAATLINHGRME